MDDLLSTKQLMDLLGLDRTTIYRMLNDGRLPGIRVGGQWRFHRQTIEKWLQDQSLSTRSDSKTETEAAAPAPFEVLPLYCLQPIQEVFALSSLVGAVTTDLNGKPIIQPSNSCALCNLVMGTPEGRARCEASWKKLADRTDTPVLERCHAGLTYARGRIVVERAFVAMIFVGQFVVGSSEALRSAEHLRRLAADCGIDEDELTKAAASVRVLEPDRAGSLLGLVQMVAETFSKIGKERKDLMERLQRVAEIAAVSSS